MKKHRYRWLLLGAAILVIAFVWHRMADRGPWYAGKNIRYWFNDPEWMQGEAMDAFHNMGASAVPYLIGRLNEQDSRWERFYWNHWRQLPVWIRRRVPVPRLPNSRQEHALSILTFIGHPAQSALPDLIHVYERAFRTRYQLPRDYPLDWAAQSTNRASVGVIPSAPKNGTFTNKAGLVMSSRPIATPGDFLWQSELRTLLEIGGDDQAIIPLLFVALREPNRNVQLDLASRIRARTWQPSAVKACEPILSALAKDEQPIVRLAAADLLLTVAPDRKELIAIVTGSLADSDPMIRLAATASLAFVRYEPATVVPALFTLLGDVPTLPLGGRSPSGTREKAVEGLVRQGQNNVEAIRLLVTGLSHTNPSIRAGVCEALAKVGPPASAALPQLSQMARETSEPDALIRFEAALALWTIGGQDEAVSQAFSAVYRDADRQNRWNLLIYWQNSGFPGKPVVPVLIDILEKDDSNRFRARAARMLGQIGPVASAAIPALEHALQDEFPSVRTTAADSLKQVKPE